MAYFDWNDKMMTGIPIIDNQHKQLVSYVNRLNDAMQEGKGRTIIGQIVADLIAYTEQHFALEERAFAKYSWEKRIQHTKLHHDLLAKVHEFNDRLTKNELTMSIEVLKFLATWVREHIMKEDMAYAPFLRDKDIS